MAKKSEELIEKPVASRGRPSLKVSKKSTSEPKEVKKESTLKKTSTSKKANKKISKPTSKKDKKENLAEIKDVEKIETITETLVENVEPVKKAKRTIKNISAKKTSSTKSNTKINTKTVSKRRISSSKRGVILTPVSENGPEIIVAPKNNKRTLKLNLETTKKTANSELSKPTSYEEKINQNSVFFNSPSIFTKFNIDITNADPEETVEIQSELSDISEIEPDSKSESIQDSQINIETEIALEEKDIIETVVGILESNISETESSGSNTENNNQEIESLDLNSENETQSDNLISEVEVQENDDTIILDESVLETNTELIQESEINEISDEIDSDLLEDLIEENYINELIESDINITDAETSTESDTSSSEVIDISSESEKLQEVADTIIEEPIAHKSTSDNPIGKFFDSSIPSMTSTVNNTFTKIKKSIFNISPIFKKFTFEEASLANNKNNEQVEETFSSQPENNLTDIQKALENFVPNTNDISEIEIQAEPSTLSIPIIETETPASPITSDFTSTELSETNISDYTNVITPVSDSSYYSEEYDEIEEYDFSNKLVDKLILEAESLNENENEDTATDSEITESNIDSNDISLEDVEKLKQDDYNDETFSIESYFGITDIDNDTDSNNESNETNIDSNFTESSESNDSTSLSSEEFVNKFLETNTESQVNDSEIPTESIEETNNNEDSISSSENDEFEKTLKEKDLEISTLSKLLEKYSETISSLSDRIASLENKNQEESTVESENVNNNIVDNDINQELDLDSIQIEDLDIDLNDILDDDEQSVEEPSLIPTVEDESSSDVDSNDSELVESLLSEAFLAKDLDSSLKDELLSEVLSFEENTENNDLDNELLESALLESLSNDELSSIENTVVTDKLETETTLETSNSTNNSDDFFKIIDSLTKAITELEQIPDIKQEATPPSNVDELPNELISTVTEEKAINILINKDDIFSISILNETYEIVSDFDGTSVLSENIHISTPKNNFYVKVGNKYIEIHNKKDHFVLNTNFEDIEFANAINNIAFAKKNNKIELNIKEAFKLSSINNKIELSMLNKAIADLSNTTSSTTTTEENSICDNKTLLISEETQKVYLPYTIEDVMKKLRTSDEYQTVQEIIDNEYTLPLSTFKMPIISRFKEAYRFMRVKEKSSVYAAVDLAVELMFNSNLNPAVIRAAKDLKELNIYLDCLYENEVEKFDCFKIVYKVLPKIK